MVTKKALAQSLKELMCELPFEKITINDVSEKSDLSRNTFYYHFSDINDLLEWIYANEVVKGLENYENLENWQEGLLKVLNYIEYNRRFCLNTFNSVNRNHLEGFLYKTTYDMLISIINKSYRDVEITSVEKEQIADFYGRAIVSQVIQWLITRMQEDKNDFIKRIDYVTHGVLETIVSNNDCEC